MTDLQRSELGDMDVSPAYKETALELPPDLTVEEWTGLGKTLGHMYRGNRWWLADWINYGERTYDGDMFTQYVDVCGLKPHTVSTMAWVGREVEPARRRAESSTGLTFSHHREIAPLASDIGDELLDRAEAEGWGRNRLREEVKELTGDNVHFSSDSAEWYTPACHPGRDTSARRDRTGPVRRFKQKRASGNPLHPARRRVEPGVGRGGLFEPALRQCHTRLDKEAQERI